MANDVLGSITGSGYHVASGDYNNDAAVVRFVADGVFGNNIAPGRIEFGTSPDGGDGLNTRMTIDKNGHVFPASVKDLQTNKEDCKITAVN